jgi:electron transport protein HydN
MNRFIAATPSKCIGCRTCEIACALSHAGANTLTQLGAVDVDELFAQLPFMPRITLIRDETVCMPVTCRHCDDAPCLNACPKGAIAYKDDSVQVDQERCVGCKTCMLVCPYGAMNVVTVPVARRHGDVAVAAGVKAQAQKCDLCRGRAKGPACVANCPTQALAVMGSADMEKTLQRRRESAALGAEARG